MKRIKITIPTKLSDIKLSQYQKFARTTKDSEDDKFIARQIVGIFCNLPDNVVGQIKAKDFEGIVLSITNVLNQKPEFKTKFKKDGVEYGFIPKLDDITVDEKSDLDIYLTDMDKMDKAMSVMYRPIKTQTNKGYLIEDYDEEVEGLDVTLDIAFGANVFFSSLMKDLLNFTQSFISDQVEHNPKVLQTLEANGVGITAFTNSLEETFLNLKTLVNLDYMKH